MLKILTLCLCSLVFLSPCAVASEKEDAISTNDLAALAVTNVLDPSTVTNSMWFPVGEGLVYKLYWGIIPVGEASFTSQWVNVEGKVMLSLQAEARTTSVVSKIYPVDDYIESLIDPDTFLPLRYIQKLNEGRHKRRDLTVFDHTAGKAVWSSILKDKTKTLDVASNTRDVLCLTYKMRSTGIRPGQVERFKVLVDDELYDLEVNALKFSEIKVKMLEDKKVRTVEVEPKAKFGGIFVRKGKVRLWFSDDERKLCVKITAKLPIASLKAILKDVNGPGRDSWTQAALDKKD